MTLDQLRYFTAVCKYGSVSRGAESLSISQPSVSNAITNLEKEFGVELTLDHCTDGAVIADELAKEGYPAFIGPSLGSKSKVELSNKSFTTPQVLHKAGVHISIITDAPVIPLQYLPMCAGLAADAGFAQEEAWKAITINPATALGIADRVGSLEVGKDADIVIWSADPITTLGAAACVTIIDGKVVYQR